MEEKDFEEHHQDEFRCTDCGFKSHSKSEFVDHSMTHISMENENDNDIVIRNNATDNLPLVDLEDNHNILESSSCIRSVSINENDHPENSRSIVKREHNTREENSSNGDTQETKIGIKRIKLEPEDIDIEQDIDSHHSSYENDDYGDTDIKQDLKNFNLRILKTENWAFSNEKDTESENTNMINEGFTFAHDGLLKPTKKEEKKEFSKYFDYLFEFKAVYRGLKSIDVIFCKICNFSSRKMSDLYNHAGEHIQKLGKTLIPRSSLPVNYDYFVCTICHNRIMSKVDIQMHMKAHKNVPFSSAIVDVKFIQNFDNKGKADVLLHCCEICNLAFIRYIGIVKHLNDHTPEEIAAADVYNDYNYSNSDDHGHFLEALDNDKDMLDSTCHIGGPMRRGTPKLEVEIDNTGKYVPDGWQRKVFQITKGSQKGNYKVWFISPFGYFFYNKQNVSKHIESLESKGITQCINVELMDFSTDSHNLPRNEYKRKKKRGKAGRQSEEVEIDNTNIYVPEGWQRKVHMITTGPSKGKHFIKYVSPYNVNIYSRSSASKYLETLEQKGVHLSINVNKLDYSIPSHLTKKPPARITKVEVEIDNTGKYIPDGWHRKMFQITQGADKGIHKIAYISPLGNLLYCRTVVSKHLEKLESIGNCTPVNVEEMDFILPSSYYSYIKRKGSKKRKGKAPRQRVDVELDNKDVYVPDGWKRKCFKYINGPSKGQYFISYHSPFDKEIQGKTKMEEYLKSLEKKDCHMTVDIEKLNFSIPSELCKIKPSDHNKVEVEIDNTGIYIPEGWQRKVIQMTQGPETGSYKVHYITPNGKVLYHRGHVLEHIQKSEDEGITLSVNVDDMDFRPSSNNLYNKVKEKRKIGKNLSPRPREEIDVDNTDIYIPEGWQRKAFMYTSGPSKGKYIIRYISEYDNKEIFSKKHMNEYLESLKIDNCSFSIDIQRLSFSVSPSQFKIKPVNDSKTLNE